MKTILVPTDFSGASENAIDFAIAFAKKENAMIILLHAYHITYPASDFSGEIISKEVSELKNISEEKLRNLCLKIMQTDKVKCERVCKEGLAVDIILEASRRMHPDFIIMGTKGSSGIKEIFLGSNTTKVIEKAQHPVIAVPDGTLFHGIKKITYATNYYESDVDAIKTLCEIAEPFKAVINILHISEGEYVPEIENELLKQFVSKVSKQVNYNNFSFQLIIGKDIEKELSNYLMSSSADLFSMSIFHRNLFEKIFGKSITKKLAYHTHVPLLAFHHKKESVVFT
ncbi:MAG: universal stress protein [Bacteroidetes bacterium]|nr:universal stress protein [Bacteroidota bacterium]